MTSAPWSAAAYPALSGALEFVTTARVVTAAGAAVATLSHLKGECTFDEEWSPYVQATLTAANPGVVIDPRAGHRLRIDAGYVYADGTRDVHQLADLSITSADTDTVPGTVSLTAQSDEILVQQSAQWQVVDIVNTYATYATAVADLLTRALYPFAPTIVTGGMDGTGDTLTDYRVVIGTPWWSHVQTLANVAGGVVYCDEARTWHLDTYTTDESPDVDTYLSTGDVPPTWPTVTDAPYNLPVLTQVGTVRSRDDWANCVMVDHVWTHTDGSYQRVAQRAEVTTGPYAVATVGYRVHSETRDTPIWTVGEAYAECAAILYRTQRRGEQRRLTARAAYWLRPRSLHRMWLSGTDMYARITRVTYHLDGSGLMDLTTRTPEPEGAGGS